MTVHKNFFGFLVKAYEGEATEAKLLFELETEIVKDTGLRGSDLSSECVGSGWGTPTVWSISERFFYQRNQTWRTSC